ncbi:DNA-binding transcriptional LysR family regulator [Saccharopolyspora spinosa]|uniref:DNA-binding transcriptional LysR family regulator n=2 Tax=Saccharopolyspora spinosa TaxID=60894 RepID=A0A2N3Y1P6_SACSN|nr:DNA-binding transcriptional LysR family regulator [Saccharopolyspora spinosa]
MELRHIQAFIAVAEELSFRRAAERLKMAQAPLSQQIKRLEREVGTQLLHRTTRQVNLTAAGSAFLHEARRAVDAVKEAPHAARLAAAGETGVLRLGVSGPTFYEVLVLMASRFRAQCPHIRLEISGPAFGGELIGQLDRDEIDACLVRLPVPGTGIVVRKITEHGMAAALPEDHRLARRRQVRIRDLLAEPIVGYPSNRGAGTVTRIHSAFLEHGSSPNIVQEAPDTHTIILMVAIGTGIGLVPVSASHLKVPGVVLVPIVDMPPLPLALAWRGDDRNPVLLTLIGMLDEVCADFVT